MLGLFGTLNMGARSLQTQQQGVEIAGNNLANVNNPAYARQRLEIHSSGTIPDAVGPQGTGAESVAIRQIRDALIDRQLSSEISVTGFLEAEQKAYQYAQANLGQQIDRVGEADGQNGTAEYLNGLFAAWQSVSTNPTSLPVRHVLVLKAESLTTQFNQVDQRLDNLGQTLNAAVQDDVGKVNTLLRDIATLNDRIINTEYRSPGMANELRDARLAQIEKLAGFVNIQTAEQANGSIDISVDGNLLVSDNQLLDSIETYDNGSGGLLIRLQGSGTGLNVTGGSIAGSITARDTGVQNLRDELNALAGLVITEVNAVHQAGYSLNGTTGEPFFTGTSAADIQVNSNILKNPGLLQASADATAVGDNQVAVAIAQLASKTHAALSDQTFSEKYGQTVAALGQSLKGVNDQLGNQKIVEDMIRRQRDSISGVSLDEEMTDMMRFQRAYQASAKLINTVDQMLEIIMSLKR